MADFCSAVDTSESMLPKFCRWLPCERAHSLSRDEFEHGVEMPHGAMPGTAKEISRNGARIDIIGPGGALAI